VWSPLLALGVRGVQDQGSGQIPAQAGGVQAGAVGALCWMLVMWVLVWWARC